MATILQSAQPVYAVGLLGATVTGQPFDHDLLMARLEEIELRILAMEALQGVTADNGCMVRATGEPPKLPFEYQEA